MKQNLTRRGFLGRSLASASLAGAALSFEEKSLLAQDRVDTGSPATPPRDFPCGKIGKLSISRLICGGNLISGFAHARDLLYVSPLLKHYFTDAKVFETLRRCEAQGLNTAILRLDDDTLRILKAYWKEHGGKIQWIAQIAVTEQRMTEQIQQAVDHGAVGVYTHGGIADRWVKEEKVELLGKAIEFGKKLGVIAGTAAHELAVIKACEKAGLKPDFYMKTFNSKRYWSAGPMPRLDSVWEETPQETAAFMEDLGRPWIAYKVLGAGAIHPREGFRYAYENGADFLCVGMFDFQVDEDADIARKSLERARSRTRPWMG